MVQQTQTQPTQDRLTVKVATAAKLLDIGKTRIFQMIRDGELESVMIGGTRMVHYDSLLRLRDNGLNLVQSGTGL